MIKIDFHIHTKAIDPWDKKFDFSENRLKSYIKENEIDCIAITNHNRFDITQYEEICSAIPDIEILPGIEIHVLNGHIIVVGSKKDIDGIEKISKALSETITEAEDSLSLDEFSQLVDGHKYLIIPHYEKSKSLALSNIKKIKSSVFVGEVGSPKKFMSMLNNDFEELTPLLFSDLRCVDLVDENKSQETRYTYLKTDSTDFNTIYYALQKKSNVALSSFEKDTFDVLNGTVSAHKGINVILGNRSSGKSYLLDNIFSSFQSEGNVLYIKQFELAKNSETNEFKANVEDSNVLEIRRYCADINSLLIEIKESDYSQDCFDAEKYLQTLKDFADKRSMENAFSRMKLFNYVKKPDLGKNNDKEVVNALAELISVDAERRQIIERVIAISELKELLRVFIKRAKEYEYKRIITERTNTIAEVIAKQLAKKSALKSVPPISFTDIYRKIYLKKKTDNLLLNLKKKTIVDKLVSDKFHRRISIFKPTYSNKETYKKETGHIRNEELKNPNSLFDVFVDRTKDYSSSSSDDLFSYFIGVESSVTTDGDKELSGGEKAEYILIDKLQSYADYDIVLIDEMESSFDNTYLNNYINELLHEISEKCTVFVSTHNNNLGVSLKPDYYIYHEYVFDEGREIFKRYYGSSTSKMLSSSEGDEKKLNEVLLGTMEASIDAYDERKTRYEVS